VRGEKVGGRNGRLGSREGSLNAYWWSGHLLKSIPDVIPKTGFFLSFFSFGFGFAAVAYVG
jgi:hypothetical protein